MRKTLFLLLFLLGCATQAPTPLALADAAAKTTGAYVDMTIASLQRGRITVETAKVNLAKAKTVQTQLKTAETLLKGCPPPCVAYDSLLKSIQPTLFELEREMRDAQGVPK